MRLWEIVLDEKSANHRFFITHDVSFDICLIQDLKVMCGLEPFDELIAILNAELISKKYDTLSEKEIETIRAIYKSPYDIEKLKEIVDG